MEGRVAHTGTELAQKGLYFSVGPLEKKQMALAGAFRLRFGKRSSAKSMTYTSSLSKQSHHVSLDARV